MPSSTDSKTDLEKVDLQPVQPAEVVLEEEVASATGPFARLTRWLDAQGVEARGLDRVPESERQPASGWSQLCFWFSVNLSFSALATGSLGAQYFTLDFKTTVAVIIPMCALGCCLSAWVATLGPKYGLRTMALNRFAGGVPGTFIFSLLNILTQLSYAVTTALAGAQALRAVNHDVSLIVGIVVVSVVVFVLSIFGYKWVHHYERYSWIVCAIIYFICLGMGSKGDYQTDLATPDMDTGNELIGDVLSFAGIMFSVSSGWTSIAAGMRASSNSSLEPSLTLADRLQRPPAGRYAPSRVFLITWLGTYIPIVFTTITSAARMTISNPDYIAAHDADGLGGIVGAILGPVGGFGKFLLVLLAFSTIAANIPNTYSGALCMQSLHPILLKVPRVLFVCLFTIIYLIAAIVGREHFSEIVSNFASLLSYWTAFFTVILALEMVYFRRAGGPLGGINPDHFNDFDKLPPGFACVGAIAVAIGGIAPRWPRLTTLGLSLSPWPSRMAAIWASSALGVRRWELTLSPSAGFEFSAVFTFFSYLLFRTLEIKYFKR